LPTDGLQVPIATLAVAILELKKWGGHCGAKEKVGGTNKVIYCICIGPMSTK